ncbi:MAG TPA: hypothetical protein VG497_13410 [Kribbella sp.]|nr:hypothetical protein [Kribbella sp.]
MTGRIAGMIPLGPVEFSPADVALILAVLALGATALALPATLTLAWVGHRRAAVHRGWNAVWYWFCGTGLSVGTTFATATHLRWWAVPLGWAPSLVVAWVLNPRGTPKAS